jgi:hypothetical protein
MRALFVTKHQIFSRNVKLINGLVSEQIGRLSCPGEERFGWEENGVFVVEKHSIGRAKWNEIERELIRVSAVDTAEGARPLTSKEPPLRRQTLTHRPSSLNGSSIALYQRYAFSYICIIGDIKGTYNHVVVALSHLWARLLSSCYSLKIFSPPFIYLHQAACMTFMLPIKCTQSYLPNYQAILGYGPMKFHHSLWSRSLALLGTWGRNSSVWALMVCT